MRYMNFGYILEKKRDYFPNNEAVVDFSAGARYSYSELDARANKTAAALKRIGLQKGDNFLGIFQNTVEFFDYFFASAKLGTRLALANYRWGPREIESAIEDVTPRVIVYDRAFREKLEPCREDGAGIDRFVCVGGEPERGDDSHDDLIADEEDRSPGVSAGMDDVSVVLFTSGSTGRPKAVPQTHLNSFFKSIDYVIDMSITRKDIALNPTPLFHSGGLNILTLPLLHVGGKVVICKKFEPETMWKIIEAEKATIFFVIPTALRMMLRVPGWESHDIGSLRAIAAGGEPIPASLKSIFLERGIPLLNAYGLTETADGTLFMREEEVDGKAPHCNGRTFTHVDVRIVDDAGDEVPAGEVGEIIHRGPCVAAGYWNRPEESERKFRDGWIYTGDLGMRDKEGLYYIMGRKDDMIISGGENIYPSEVEEAISSHPTVAEVVVFGIPDEEWGQRVKAVIAPKKGMNLTKEEVVDHCKKLISSYKKPTVIQFLEDLPKLGSGKVDRSLIVQEYGGT